jgi:hypothetical protein
VRGLAVFREITKATAVSIDGSEALWKVFNHADAAQPVINVD